MSVSQFSIDDEEEDLFDMSVDDDTTGALPLTESIVSAKNNPTASNDPESDHKDPAIPDLSPVSEDVNASFDTTTSEAEEEEETKRETTSSNGILEPKNAKVVAKANEVVANGPADLQYHSEILDLKIKRKRRTAALGVVAGVGGLLLLGPIGGIAAGASAAIIAKTAGKRKEKQKRKELEKKRQVDEAMDEAEASFVQAKSGGVDKDGGEPDDSTITTSSSSHSLTSPIPSSSSSSVSVE